MKTLIIHLFFQIWLAALLSLWTSSVQSSTHNSNSRNAGIKSFLFIIPNAPSSLLTEKLNKNQTRSPITLTEPNKVLNLTVKIAQDDSLSVLFQKQAMKKMPHNNSQMHIEPFTNTFPNLKAEKRQYSGQNFNRFISNDNQVSSGINNQIVGNTPQAAIDMVQNYVENLISSQGEERPGYIMINSPNPAIISELSSAFSQLYGSSSVINEPGAIQNLINNMPNTGEERFQIRSTTATPVNSNTMPEFPFSSYYSRKANNRIIPKNQLPGPDFIRQQLSSIANISVSSGKLINDTLDEFILADQSQIPSVPTIYYNNTYKNTSDLQTSFPATFSNPASNLNKSSTNSNDISNLITVEQIASAAPETATISPLPDQFVIHVNTSNENSSNYSLDNEPLSFVQSQTLLSDLPQHNLTFSNVSESIHIAFNQINGFDYDLSTTGYEDYYEEIDGELVLSPTKFMRKAGPISSISQGDKEYFGQDKNKSNSSSTTIFTQVDKLQEDISWGQKTGGSSQFNSGNIPVRDINMHADENGKFSERESYIINSSNTENPLSAYDINQGHNSLTNSSAVNDFKYTTSKEDTQTMNLQHLSSDTPEVQLKIEFSTNGHHWYKRNTTAYNQSQENSDEVKKVFSKADPSNNEHFRHNGHQHVSTAPSALTPQDVLNYMMEMNHNELKVLGISRNVTVIESYLNKIKAMGDPNYTFLDINGNQIQARPNFSSAHFRQSDIPANFFPTRPPHVVTHRPHHHHNHQHTTENQNLPQLTSEQEDIISRLPVGMQHVVTSIVQAVQVPLQAIVSTTTTTPPPSPQYPLPYIYPYPYPNYPYIPHISHIYPHIIPQTTPNSNHISHSNLTSHPTHTDTNDHANDYSVDSHGPQNNHGSHHAHGSHNHHHDNQDHQHDVNHHHDQQHADHHHHNHITQDNQNPNQSHNSIQSQRNSISHSTRDHHQSHPMHDIHIQGNLEAPGSVVSNSQVNDTTVTISEGDRESLGQHGESNEETNSLNQDENVSTENVVFDSSVPSSSALVNTFRPAVNPIFSQSRLGEVDDNPARETGNQNAPRQSSNGQPCSNSGSTGGICHNRISSSGTPSLPDRNQGLLQLQHNPSHMGNGQQSHSGIVNFRPPSPQNHMQMDAPVVNVVLPEVTRPVTTEEPPLIEPTERIAETQNNEASDGMDRQEMNSLLQSLFSSPTLLLLGIIFATSAAYMAIAMEEQAAQQQFQQAQLAAAFGGQPFPAGRKRRHVSSEDVWFYLPKKVQKQP